MSVAAPPTARSDRVMDKISQEPRIQAKMRISDINHRPTVGQERTDIKGKLSLPAGSQIFAMRQRCAAHMHNSNTYRKAARIDCAHNFNGHSLCAVHKLCKCAAGESFVHTIAHLLCRLRRKQPLSECTVCHTYLEANQDQESCKMVTTGNQPQTLLPSHQFTKCCQ